MKTLKTLNDSKFDLVTPRTLDSTKFEQNDPENSKNVDREIPIKSKFLKLAFGAICESLF